MAAKKKLSVKTVADYLSALPPRQRALMRRLRRAIRSAAPEAEEIISYRMPAFRQDGILAWYCAHKNHIGFYPKASGIARFKKEISGYKWAKGSVQFPLDRPLPLALVARIIRFRLGENLGKD